MAIDPRLELQTFLFLLYHRLITESQPPDQAIGGFLRKCKVRGGARGFLASASFALLRKRVRLRILWLGKGDFSHSSPTEEAACAIWRWFREDMANPIEECMASTRAVLGEAASMSPKYHVEFDADQLMNRVHEFAERVFEGTAESGLNPELRRAARYSISPEILSRWWERFGEEEAALLAESMTSKTPLDIRANEHLASTEKVLMALNEEGLEAMPSRFSPDGIRLEKKAALQHLEMTKAGWIEVQDEGSQLVCHALEPKSGWRVLDACAGGGGKTVHLGSMLAKDGQVYAHDIDASRLESVAKRVIHAQLENVRTLDPGTGDRHGPYDAVLIDAPCLGLGRLRRDPTLNWQGPIAERLDEATHAQRQCLNEYSKLVKPGGVLVYATCSIEPEETSEMIEWFLRDNPEFRRSELPATFQKPSFNPADGGEVSEVTLLPHIHETDGFYIARLEKVPD